MTQLRATLFANGQMVTSWPQWRAKDFRFCFANPVRADVLSNGRKIAGAAQRRTRRGLLQQGSIQGVDLATKFADQFASELCSSVTTKRSINI